MGYFWSQFKLIGNDRNFEDCARGVETILNTPVDLVSVLVAEFAVLALYAHFESHPRSNILRSPK